jgi:HK97 family phage major capsid protein
MKTSKELREERQRLFVQMQDLHKKCVEEKRDFTTEESTLWDKMETDEARMTKEIDRQENFEKREMELGNPTAPPAHEEKIAPEKRDALDLYHYMRGEYDQISKEGRANVQTTTTTGGGYTIPVTLMSELEVAMLAYGGLLQAGRRLNTATGEQINWPTANDTAQKAYLIGESVSAITSAEALVFGTKALNAYKYTSGLIQVPNELLRDSNQNLPQILADFFAERMGRGLNYVATLGTGSSQPQGLFHTSGGASTYTTGVAGTVITRDNLVDLIHSVDPAYRNSAKLNVGFMMNDLTLKAIKKLDHGTADSAPLYQVSARDGMPATIEGYSFFINQDMADIGKGNRSIGFGDFSKFILRYIGSPRILRSNERFMELDQAGFVMFQEFDSEYMNAGTNPIKVLLHNANT